MLPICLGNQQLKEPVNSPKSRYIYDVKIIGLADAVGARVNVILSNGQVCRNIFSWSMFHVLISFLECSLYRFRTCCYS